MRPARSGSGAGLVYADKANLRPESAALPYRGPLPLDRGESVFLIHLSLRSAEFEALSQQSTETFQLRDWDVAEVVIGSDFQDIRPYKEFEISPQGEWVDLDIDLSKPHHEDGWTWNSGFKVAARIDPATKIWYGAMRIPFSALQSRPPAVGDKFRINLFPSQGPPPNGIEVVWQPTLNHTFHTPERFGLLRLVTKEIN
jgi:hypothetical protein